MSEAGIGRVLVASLHQAIADILPTRLGFYENWLNAEGLREGTIGLAPLSAVLSFLRSEGEAYALITARAGAYGPESVVIDGNDVEMVYRTAQRALEVARRGGGPSLIEALTYRHGGHSRADPGKYRPDEEVKAWKARDPLVILGDRLAAEGLMSDDDQAAARERIQGAIDAAAERAAAAPYPTLEDARELIVGQALGSQQRLLQTVQRRFADRHEPGAEADAGRRDPLQPGNRHGVVENGVLVLHSCGGGQKLLLEQVAKAAPRQRFGIPA